MSATEPKRPRDGGDFVGRLREMNEALIRSSVRQQELADAAVSASEELRASEAWLAEQLEETELLRSLSAEMIRGSVEPLYAKIVDTAAALMHSDFASLQEFRPERGSEGELHLRAHHGFTSETAREWEWVSAGRTTLCGVALATGKRVVVPDVETCALLAGEEARAAYRRAGIRGVQSTPLVSRSGSRVGMLSTHWRAVHEPSAHELQVFDLLARQAADLTDRSHAEERLRASESEARRLLDLHRSTTESMAEGVFTLDLQGRTTSVNPEAERLLGWEPGTLLGRVMHEEIHCERPSGAQLPLAECADRAVLATGTVVKDCEDVFIRRDGESLHVSYSSAPLRDEQGAVVGLVTVFQDMGERKRIRQELQEAAERLADVNRRKDEFLAMLSHELRTPLAPIRTAVHVLRMRAVADTDPIERQAREVIERQVGNLTKIVADILEISRVVIGRIRLDVRTLDLNRIAADAVETTRPFAEQRLHELSLVASTDPLWVKGDATRLEEVLVNLLENAVKYTPDGGHIQLHCEQPAGTEDAQIRVRDDGMGIDEELLRDGRLFDLFSQADRSLARSAGGLGIGLSLAKRLMSLHDGSIAVRSPPEGAERGSEFIVRLPLAAAPALPDVEASAAPLPSPQGLRVLVVDDSIDLVEMLRISLQQAGYQVETACSGAEALAFAHLWRPDVVLLDIGLPDLDGYEVARRLRASPVLAGLGAPMRLVAMTGYGQQSDLALAREAGFDTHLTKPIAFHVLERVLAPPAPPRT